MKPEIDDILVKLYPVYKDLPEVDFINDQDDVYTKDDFWDDLSNKEKYNVNSLYLKMIGDPKHDYIMCWEPGRFDENEAVTDYTNFYDVDYKWWEFQKNANWSNIEDQKKMMMSGSKTYTPEKVAESINSFNDEYSEYKISMTGDWYRLIERDTFIYAEMISLKWYLFYKAEFFLDSLQDEHIPYELKDADFETLLNTRDPEEKYNAAGREKELESFYRTCISCCRSCLFFFFLIMNSRNDKKRKHCGGAEKIRALNKKKLALDAEKCLKINNMFKHLKPVCETMPDETVSYTDNNSFL